MIPVPSVSVVIPTIGRIELNEAIRSVVAQTSRPHEIIIAYDGLDVDSLDIPDVDGITVRVVSTGGGRRANGARNAGISVARGELIALLDDDDEWREDKLAVQLDELSRLELPADSRWVFASALEVTGELHDATWGRIPIRRDQSVADYLFAGTWRSTSPALQPSTWIAPRFVFAEIPFPENVGLHDDWDWLIRAQHDAGVEVRATGQPLVRYRVGAADSIVASSSWHDSVQWINDPTLPVSSRLRSDFVLSQAHRAALRSAGRMEGIKVIRYSLTIGRPSAAAFAKACFRTISSRHQKVLSAARRSTFDSN